MGNICVLVALLPFSNTFKCHIEAVVKVGFFWECFENRLLSHCGFEAEFKCHALKNQALL